MQKNPKGGFSAHSGAKKAQKWGFSKKLSKNRQIKSSQVICDPKSQLFMSQFLNFQSETKIVKMTHSEGGTARAKASHLCHKVRLPQITSREALGFIVFILIMTFPVAKLDGASGNYIVQCT